AQFALSLCIVRSVPAGLLVRGDRSARGWVAHCSREINVLVIHHEPEDAPACAAAEAMKRLPGRAHHERRRFLLMKGAEGLKIRSRAFQWKIRTDHFDDIVRGGDLLDCLRRDRSHARLIIFASFGFGSDAKLTQWDSISKL